MKVRSSAEKMDRLGKRSRGPMFAGFVFDWIQRRVQRPAVGGIRRGVDAKNERSGGHAAWPISPPSLLEWGRRLTPSPTCKQPLGLKTGRKLRRRHTHADCWAGIAHPPPPWPENGTPSVNPLSARALEEGVSDHPSPDTTCNVMSGAQCGTCLPRGKAVGQVGSWFLTSFVCSQMHGGGVPSPPPPTYKQPPS